MRTQKFSLALCEQRPKATLVMTCRQFGISVTVLNSTCYFLRGETTTVYADKIFSSFLCFHSAEFSLSTSLLSVQKRVISCWSAHT